MALQNERDELDSAWRALSGISQDADGWRSILLSASDRIFAGRHFPGNEEAVLVGFAGVHIPTNDNLPQGNGFVVARVDAHEKPGRRWLALSRRPEGNLDIFTMMVLDVIRTLSSPSATSEENAFQLFLTRIRAWQDFMRRGMTTTLEPQAEIGLFGELVILQSAINAGLHPAIPTEGWVGPLRALQDFELGTGAIEVKTTIATIGFRAVIDSLDQLDDAVRQPLFLAAVRLQVDNVGSSLSQIVEQARAIIGHDPAKDILNTRLLYAGYIDAAAGYYTRKFKTVEVKFLPVTSSFPRLTKASIPSPIVCARYEIELDHVSSRIVGIMEVLEQLGVM